MLFFFFFFFFQAEDGIRDTSVTGVQTCALPISIMLSFISKLGNSRRTLAGERCLGTRVPILEVAERRSRRRRGAAAVELAIAAPVVFFITLGIVDVGRCLIVIHLLNNAPQLGCR